MSVPSNLRVRPFGRVADTIIDYHPIQVFDVDTFVQVAPLALVAKRASSEIERLEPDLVLYLSLPSCY
jgi:hypothetical protein